MDIFHLETKKGRKPGTVVHACNPSAWQAAEEGGSPVVGKPRLHNKTSSKHQRKRRNRKRKEGMKDRRRQGGPVEGRKEGEKGNYVDSNVHSVAIFTLYWECDFTKVSREAWEKVVSHRLSTCLQRTCMTSTTCTQNFTQQWVLCQTHGQWVGQQESPDPLLTPNLNCYIYGVLDISYLFVPLSFDCSLQNY